MLQSFDEFVLFSFLIFVNRSCDNVLKKVLHYQFFKFRIIKRFDKGGEFSIESTNYIFGILHMCIYVFYIKWNSLHISIKTIFIYFLFEEGWIIVSQKKERRKNVRTRDKNNIEFCVLNRVLI